MAVRHTIRDGKKEKWETERRKRFAMAVYDKTGS
tara:strand:- start:897 stop:998 length:102 start_codon:yes stop_codon:yes gene_type:complete